MFMLQRSSTMIVECFMKLGVIRSWLKVKITVTGFNVISIELIRVIWSWSN